MRWVIGVLTALLLAPTASGREVVATLDDYSDVEALGGWIVWSEQVGEAGRSRLVGMRDGERVTLGAKTRPKAFDFDLGTDRRGRMVAVFSRCAEMGNGVEPYGPLVDRGCRIRILDLESGRERDAGEPRPPGMSHIAPAIWRGRIAYSEFRPVREEDSEEVAEIVLWSPITGRLERERHGSVGFGTGWVESMDLNDQLLAYVWRTYTDFGPRIELRANRRDGTSVLIDEGGFGEACAGVAVIPSPPALVGRRVWFTHGFFDCDNGKTWLARYDARTGKTVRARIGSRLVGYARAGSVGYGLFSHPAREDGSLAPLTLERLPDPVRL